MPTPPASSAPARTMLLTGASRGIGHATVKRFSSAGWRVITCSRHAFPESCPWMAGPQDHLQINLADADDTARAIREVRERLDGGRLDALVNNAAISPKGPGGSRLGLFGTEFADWLTVFQVNFFAPALLARGLGAELERAQGAIVNVTSIAGSRVHPFAGIAYATSKAALGALTREMAADFGPRGVRVNAISPGEIDTAILSPGTEAIVAEIPMRRLGTASEVAKAIYFLCTEQSSYVNGAELLINGGQHV
jgi:NAD(P)-dependent dehydrogenase (short-subunit alcohol dehydrogenase family)